MPQHWCAHTWAKHWTEINYLHHSLLHRFFTQRKQLKMSFLGKKSHFQCQFHNQMVEKMMGHFKLGVHLPLSLPANPLQAKTGAGVGKITGSAGTDKMLILQTIFVFSIWKMHRGQISCYERVLIKPKALQLFLIICWLSWDPVCRVCFCRIST